MRRKLLYLFLTILGLFIAYAIPLDATKYEEAGKPIVKVNPIEAIQEPKVELASEVSTIETKPAVAPVNASYSGSGDQYLDYIISHESSGNPFAVNSIGACGLFQALPCSKLGCDLANIQCQIDWGRNYAISRYGSTYAAYVFWVNNHWW